MGVGNTINFAPEAYSKKPALGPKVSVEQSKE